jgi:large subunit ribosomal protein L22
MEAMARSKYVGVPARKARRVVDLIRGKYVDEALDILRYIPQAASEPTLKTVKSAAANALQKAGSVRVEDLVIKEAYVDEGPSMKRFRSAPRGRALRIRKRSSHITIVVADEE